MLLCRTHTVDRQIIYRLTWPSLDARVSFYKSMGGKDGKVQCLTIWVTYFRFKNAQDRFRPSFLVGGVPQTTASGEVVGFDLNKNLVNPSEIISKSLKDVNHFLSGDSWMYPYTRNPYYISPVATLLGVPPPITS